MEMSGFKIMVYSALVGIFLTSCSAVINTIPVPNGVNNTLNIPAKKEN